jgi:UDP-glucose 4-epimerase
LAQEITGDQLNIRYRPARGQDVKAIVLESTAFQRQFDWQPKVSLEDGLERTWHWLQGQA